MNPNPSFSNSASQQTPGATGRDCIIIADDADMSLAILRNMLSPHFELIEAHNGAEVVQILRTPPKPIAAVLLDVVMPIMNGFQVLDFMQKNGLLGVIPAITITALSDPQSRIQCYEAGATDIIEKPYDSEYLVYKVRWVIDRFRNMRAIAANPVAQAQVEQLEAVLSAVPAAIFAEDPSSNVILHCNTSFLKMRGVPPNPIGQSIETFPFPPETRAAIRAAREAVLVRNLSQPALFPGTSPGSYYSILYRPFLNPVSSVTQLLGYITNVTYEVQNRTALENRIRELEGQRA